MASSNDPPPIPFVDLQAQRRRLGPALDEAIGRVLEHGRFVMGPEVLELEQRLAAFCGARHAITCASGTDALALGLMALGVGPGDAVLVPAFTFAASAEVVPWFGATPLFVDVLPETFNLDPASLERGIATAREEGLVPRGVIAVDLFGQPADYDAIEAIARAAGLWVLADAAQSFGAGYGGRSVGRLGGLTATSFFPAKPLGAYGDGGAVLSDDDGHAALVRSLREHGQGTDRYDNVRIGMNARLDTLQAAILLVKLGAFRDEIAARERVAARYREALAGAPLRLPVAAPPARSVWAQYTVVLEPPHERDAVALALRRAGVPTAVYYPRPLHRQPAYARFPCAAGGLAVAERLAGAVLSLPIHPDLEPATQERIVEGLLLALRTG